MERLSVAVVFGGRSVEHEVSIRSARTICAALDEKRFKIIPLAVSKRGRWLPLSQSKMLLEKGESATAEMEGGASILDSFLNVLSSITSTQRIDLVFPIIHGSFGEDGTLQGLLKMLDIPYVGPDILGSSICMDKDVAKRLLKQAGIPVVPFVCVESHGLDKFETEQAIKQLGLPLFVKPSSGGSSVGTRKVKTAGELSEALKKAARYDRKVLIEKFIKGREIECSVMGNEEIEASIPGEIIPGAEFYDYDAKYSANSKSQVQIPAALSEEQIQTIRERAISAFKVLCCEGMARVDFFVADDGEIYLNEVNTIPGFTSISMYPKMWEASGLPLASLVARLIDLARARHQREAKLAISADESNK